MNGLGAALWAEALKARRSKAPLVTFLGFALLPLAGAFFMIILRDPEAARNMGLISAKAQIVAGASDWPAYLSFLAQAAAIGGFLLFGMVASWVFGREFVDRAAKDLLALPTSRAAIVTAKFIVIGVWTSLLVVFILAVGLLVGRLIGLPGWSQQVALQGFATLAKITFLSILLIPPVAFFACLGRGYLAPMGFVFLVVFFTQILSYAGWGEYFPWAALAILSGTGSDAGAPLGLPSYLIILATCLAGLAVTYAWWQYADQSS